MGYDFVTWGAFACVLSALGGALTWRAWRRRGLTAGLRGLAWSLLPVAAWLTGTLHLLANIVADVGDWAVHLVFSPVVWLGIAVAGLAVVLFGVSGAMRARGIGRRTRAAGGQLPPQRQQPSPGRSSGPSSDLEDMEDIEAILRKHGIS